jgi:transcriptional regulator with XRE-family HTH domain
MSELGRKLRSIRRQRHLSLRQVESLTATLEKKGGDALRRVSASWLGRLEREEHSIPHRTLATLEAVYGVSHEELADEYVSTEEASRTLHAHLPELPAVVLKGLTDPAGSYLLPPESWLAYFPETTLLPSLPTLDGVQPPTRRRSHAARLYGVEGLSLRLGTPDLFPSLPRQLPLRMVRTGPRAAMAYARPVRIDEGPSTEVALP